MRPAPQQHRFWPLWFTIVARWTKAANQSTALGPVRPTSQRASLFENAARPGGATSTNSKINGVAMVGAEVMSLSGDLTGPEEVCVRGAMLGWAFALPVRHQCGYWERVGILIANIEGIAPPLIQRHRVTQPVADNVVFIEG